MLLPVARAAVGAVTPESRMPRQLASLEAQALQRLGRVDEMPAACDRVSEADDELQLLASECRCSAGISAGRLAQAKIDCTENVERTERRYGAQHPRAGSSWNNLAIVHNRLGEYAEAVALWERALAIDEATHGPASREIVGKLRNLGNAKGNLGRHAESRALLERALTIVEALSDRPTREVADIHDMLAKRTLAQGEIETSLHHGDEAVRIAEQVLGPDHPDMAMKRWSQALAYAGAGRHADALAGLERALAIAIATVGEQHLLVAAIVSSQADSLMALKRYDEAVVAAERALRVVGGVETSAENKAGVRATLGHALLLAGERARGRRELTQAAAVLATLGEPAAPALAEVQALLAR
jgi:tetratricopeptide (TPR) repeat protein